MSTTGTVKWFDPREGQGAITPDGGGRDIPFESVAIAPGVTLRSGLRVEFEVTSNPKGLLATRVFLPRG